MTKNINQIYKIINFIIYKINNTIISMDNKNLNEFDFIHLKK